MMTSVLYLDYRVDRGDRTPTGLYNSTCGRIATVPRGSTNLSVESRDVTIAALGWAVSCPYDDGRMEIFFATEVMREACLARDPKPLQLPIAALAALQSFYHAMRNAEHVAELPLGGPGPDGLTKELEWRAELEDGYWVVMRVNHATPPQTDGKLDLSRVYRVKIIAIEGPNG